VDLATEAIRAAEQAVTDVEWKSNRMAQNNFSHVRLTCGVDCSNTTWICDGLDGFLQLLLDEQKPENRAQVLQQVANYADSAKRVAPEAAERIILILGQSLSPNPSPSSSPSSSPFSKSPSLSLFPDHPALTPI